MSRAETSLWERRVVATEGGPAGRALRTSSAGKHDEASEAVRRTRASGEAEANQVSTTAEIAGGRQGDDFSQLPAPR